MPYRRRYNVFSRRPIRRRRYVSKIPYAIPPRQVVRKFSLVLPARPVGISASPNNDLIQVNNPIRPAPWLAAYAAGTQPVGLDFWIGNSTTTGPYQSGVVTYAKTHHTIWSTTSTPFIVVNWVDNSLTGTTAATPSLQMSRPGTKHVIVNDSTDLKPVTIKNRIDTLKIFQLDSPGDAFESANCLFGRTTQPSIQVYDHIKIGDPSVNAFFGTSSVWCVTKVTFWVHLRLTDMSKYDDAV